MIIVLEKTETYELDNGLKIIHMNHESQVSYCGVIVDVGSRDEADDEQGMAHFIEHMLFKGTKKRRSSQIINRLEDVGGELNAYTSKEETVIYAGFLKEYTERTIELIADLTQHASFPDREIEKEIEVIQDEIQSYKDSPYELIFDEFEELLFADNAMSHSVLGRESTIVKFDAESASAFYRRYYQPENMVFFSIGSIQPEKLRKWVEKHFAFQQNGGVNHRRIKPNPHAPKQIEHIRDTHQVHCIIGGCAYDIHHDDRLALYMLNNILGGPGMNSKLNLALREKNGLVYNVESTVQSYTDSGWWGVYFGTDAENFKKCERLVKKELAALRDNKISEAKLKKYKEQLRGQLAISNENREGLVLALGKSYLRYGKFDSTEKMQADIIKITAEQLQKVAQDLFAEEKLNMLKYS